MHKIFGLCCMMLFITFNQLSSWTLCEIFNTSKTDGRVALIGKTKMSYYDLPAYSSVTIEKSFPKVSPFTLITKTEAYMLISLEKKQFYICEGRYEKGMWPATYIQQKTDLSSCEILCWTLGLVSMNNDRDKYNLIIREKPDEETKTTDVAWTSVENNFTEEVDHLFQFGLRPVKVQTSESAAKKS